MDHHHSLGEDSPVGNSERMHYATTLSPLHEQEGDSDEHDESDSMHRADEDSFPHFANIDEESFHDETPSRSSEEMGLTYSNSGSSDDVSARLRARPSWLEQQQHQQLQQERQRQQQQQQQQQQRQQIPSDEHTDSISQLQASAKSLRENTSLSGSSLFDSGNLRPLGGRNMSGNGSSLGDEHMDSMMGLHHSTSRDHASPPNFDTPAIPEFSEESETGTDRSSTMNDSVVHNSGSIMDSVTNTIDDDTDHDDDDADNEYDRRRYGSSNNDRHSPVQRYQEFGSDDLDDDDSVGFDDDDDESESYNDGDDARGRADADAGANRRTKRLSSTSLDDHFQKQTMLEHFHQHGEEVIEALKDTSSAEKGSFPVLLTDQPTPWSRGSVHSKASSHGTHDFADANIMPDVQDPHSYHTVRTANATPNLSYLGRDKSTSAFSAISGVTNPSYVSGSHADDGTASQSTIPTVNETQNNSVTFGGTMDASESVGTYNSKSSFSNRSPTSAMRQKQRWGQNMAPPSPPSEEFTTTDSHHSGAKRIQMDGDVEDVKLRPRFSSTNSSSDNDINLLRTSSTSIDELHDTTGMESAPHNNRNNSGKRRHDESAATHTDVDVGDMSSDDGDSQEAGPIVVWNVRLPLWITEGPPPLHKISAAFVRHAPCFWVGCGNKLQRSSTDRAVLTRLNILCTFWTLVQLGAALYLACTVLFLDDQRGIFIGSTPHFWNLNGSVFAIGLLGCVLVMTSYCTIRVIQMVDLVGAIRYLWVVLWMIPAEVFFTVSLFDYHNVTTVWIRHWWTEKTLSWFRDRHCAEGMAETLCKVPLDGGPDFATEDDWCMSNFGSTDCSGIRNEAQNKMETSLLVFYTCMGVWGICLLVLLAFMINSLERIITKPIVQKSRETNVPAWLTLPTAGCTLVGSIFMYSPSSLLSASSGADNSWVGLLYLVAAGLFMVAALAGWFLSAFSIRRSADKRWKNFAVTIFIGVMAANAVILATIFIASVSFSANLGTDLIAEDQRGDVACFVDRDVSCTLCDAERPEDKCPEWTLDEVTRLLRTQLKQSASLAAIFIVYALSVLRFGIVLRKHLSLYQIDYV